MPVKPQIRSMPRATMPSDRKRPKRLSRKGGSTEGRIRAAAIRRIQGSQRRTKPEGLPPPADDKAEVEGLAMAQASTRRPFGGKRPAGRNWRNTTMRANTITLAIEVVAKKVTTSLRPAGIAGQTSRREPEPIT